MKAAALSMLLTRAGRNLNRILVSIHVARAMAWTGTVAGIAVLAARFFGLRDALTVWIALTALGGLIGFAVGRARRLDRAGTARWLDRHLGTGEALSAALICLARGCAGSFDAAIVERAEVLSAPGTKIGWPMRFLLHRAATALIVMAVFAPAIGLWSHGLGAPCTAALPGASPVQDRPGRPSGPKKASRALELPPQVVAQAMFPYDKELALQAEQALRAGDAELLNELIKQARRGMEEELARAQSPEERRRIQAEQERRQSIIRGTQSSSGNEDRDEESTAGRPAPAGGGEGRDGREQEPEGRPGKSGMASMASRREAGGRPQDGIGLTENGDLDDIYPRPPGPGSGTKGGGTPGTGRGNARGSQGRTAEKTGGDRVLIAPREDDSVLEYVLPGKGARVPLVQVVPDSRRAAEGALGHAFVPAEYADSVRWYFLALSRETAATPPKEVQP